MELGEFRPSTRDLFAAGLPKRRRERNFDDFLKVDGATNLSISTPKVTEKLWSFIFLCTVLCLARIYLFLFVTLIFGH